METRDPRTIGPAGVVLVMAALMMPLMLGFAALGIDLTYLFVARTKLRTASDSAALAGASALPGSPSDASDLADAMVDSNPVFGRIATRRQYRLGTWHADTRVFEDTIPSLADAMQVTLFVEQPQFFGRIFGRRSAQVWAGSSAANIPVDSNNMLVLDVSGSMAFAMGLNDPTPKIDGLKAGTNEYFNRMGKARGTHAVGMTTFTDDAPTIPCGNNDCAELSAEAKFPQVQQKINTLTPLYATCLVCGMESAYEHLKLKKQLKDWVAGGVMRILVVSDGSPTAQPPKPFGGCGSQSSMKATTICYANLLQEGINKTGKRTKPLVEIYTLGVGIPGYDFDPQLLMDISSQTCNKANKSRIPECFWHADNAAALQQAFAEMAAVGQLRLVE